MIALGAILSLGTLACSAEMVQSPSTSSEIGLQQNVAAGESPTPDPQQIMKEKSVQGELVKIEGAFYVVKNAAGEEVRMHVDNNTTKLGKDRAKMDREFTVGDKIEAQVGPNGHAALIQMAMAPPLAGGKEVDPQDLARRNVEQQLRLQPQPREDPGTYPPDFKPEIGGQQQAGAGDFPKPAFPFVTGELMTIEGAFYTVQDLEGKQVRLHVDKNTKMDCGPDFNGTCIFSIGDKIEARRIAPTDDHVSALRKLSSSEVAELSKAVSPVGAGLSGRMKDALVTLGGAKQALSGEVMKVEGELYVVKDHHGSEVRFVVNQNTRMWCGPEAGSLSGLLPDPSASDKPGVKGQPQDQNATNEQKGSQVGPGTKPSGTSAGCAFKTGDKIEAEISDMGAATFIKMAGRPQPGQPLP
jgi:hypothetical protein